MRIAVTTKGFEPGAITVPARKPVGLVFTRKTDATCTKTVVLTLDDGKKLERALPLDKPVEVEVTFPRAGKLGYACRATLLHRHDGGSPDAQYLSALKDSGLADKFSSDANAVAHARQVCKQLDDGGSQQGLAADKFAVDALPEVLARVPCATRQPP